MAKDLTGKNIATLKDAAFNDVVTLVDILGRDEDRIEDVFTESGSGDIPLEEHSPIRDDGTSGAPAGHVWRKDINSTLMIDTGNNHVHHDALQAKQKSGASIPCPSSDGCLMIITKVWDGGTDKAIVGPAFRYTGSDGTGYKLSLFDSNGNQVVLYKENPAGTLTVVDTAANSLPGGSVLLSIRIVLNGADIKIYINNDLKIEYTDAFNQFAVHAGLWLDWAGTPIDSTVAAFVYCDYFSFDPTLRLADRAYTALGINHIHDMFAEPSDTALENHAPDKFIPGTDWTKDTNPESSLLTVDSGNNRVFWNGGTTTARKGHVIESYLANGIVEYCVSPTHVDASNYHTFLLRFRYTGMDGTGLAIGLFSGLGDVRLYKESPVNSFTLLASSSMTLVSGGIYHVRIIFSGTSINIYVDGVRELTATTSFNQSETQVGLLNWITGTPAPSAWADNFIASPQLSYTSLIPERGISRIDMTGPEGGGLAQLSRATVRLQNQGQWSNKAQASQYFKGKSICISTLMLDNMESLLDSLALFTGRISGISDISVESLSLQCENRLTEDMIAFPRDVVNLGIYPNAPVDEIGKPIPVPFGKLDTAAMNFGTISADKPGFNLCPLLAIDVFAQRYIIYGDNNTLLGVTGFSPAFFDRANRAYIIRDDTGIAVGVGTDKHREGIITNTKRNLFLSAIRAGAGNTYTTDWPTVGDLDGSSYITVDDVNDKMTIAFGGIQPLGYIYAAPSIKTTAEGVGGTGSIDINVFRDGVLVFSFSHITSSGSRNTSSRTLTLTDWADWEFGLMTVEVTQNTGTTRLYQCVIQIPFHATENIRTSGLPLYGQVTGYEDDVSRYHDGSVISAAGETLENPSKILQAIMRDKATGWNLPVARINTAKFSTAATDTASYLWAFAITEQTKNISGTREWLQRFLRHAHLAAWLDFQDRWALDFFDPTEAAVGFFGHDYNIAVRNPGAPADQHQDSFHVLEPGPIYNDFFFRYGWSEPLQDFTRFVAATGRFLTSGVNGATNASPGTIFTAANQTFQDDFVVPGQKVYVRSGGGTAGIYTIASVDSQTQLTLSSSPGNSLSGLEFYVGPFLDATCVESFLRYSDIRTFPPEESDLRTVWDDATAQAILAKKVTYFALEKRKIEFQTFFNAIHLEYRDLVYVDHPLLPPALGKQDSGGAVATTVSAFDTQFNVTGTIPTTGDIILVEQEVMNVTAGGGNPITVGRASLGTRAAVHDGSTTSITIYSFPVKWEVLRIQTEPQASNPILCRCREV